MADRLSLLETCYNSEATRLSFQQGAIQIHQSAYLQHTPSRAPTDRSRF